MDVCKEKKKSDKTVEDVGLEEKATQNRYGNEREGEIRGELLRNTTMIICKILTHTPHLKFFLKPNFSFEEIICCIYSEFHYC